MSDQPCPRCGTTAPMARYAVCKPCTALMGWDPHCEACTVEGRGEDATGLGHVDTCGGAMKTYPSEESTR